MPIKVSEAQRYIAELLQEKGVGVLATASATGQPHAATIYFTTDEDLNIYFITKHETQKYQNLKDNARAALAVFEEKSQSTVQVVGAVSEIKDADLANKVFADILSLISRTKRDQV
jgi:general stress protein 26